jgi:hypothetical protein
MNDLEKTIQNSRLAEEVQVKIYSEMSFSQKWDETCRLREVAWKLKAAGIRAQNPTWDEQKVEAEVRKIFLYATD